MSVFFRVIKRYPHLMAGSLVLLVCFLAYGQITGMYFFLEDYLILYSIQNPNSSDAGYGSGVFGRPYGYAVTPFIPFYHLFGLNPQGYYLVEIILYFLAALAVYFLAKTLTGSRKAAFGSALIFASGYVGSGSLYRLAVGWQNLLAAIFISLSAALYYRYVKNLKMKYYLLAFAFYLFTSEFSFYRAHGIILVILGIEILFNFKPIRSLIRMLPFVLSYWYFYIYSLSGVMDQGSKASSFAKIIFTQENYRFLLTPFKTLENLFIPNQFNFPLLIFIGILFGILTWKRSKLLIYCLIFAIANYLVYFYGSPGTSQETTHRYLTISFVGVALFWGIFLGEVFRSTRKYLFFCILIVITNLVLVRTEQVSLLQNRSQPTRQFWQAFIREVQNLPKQSAIYIDSKNDGISKPARDAALGAGSMSATASFAVYYGLKWQDIYLAETFSELLSLVRDGKVEKDNIYTFFYSRQDGLVNTTQETKKTLWGDGSQVNIGARSDINLTYYSPVILKFSSGVNIDFSSVKYSTETQVDLSRYFPFLLSRDRYYDKVFVTATSEARYAGIGNIKDRDEDSGWKGNDLSWHDKHKEEVILNLGEVRRIGAVRIIPGSLPRVPTKYIYECSTDGASWEQLASFENKIAKAEPFTDKFKNADCAFVKLTIYSTVSDGPPQISEIEVLESKFSDLDIGLADAIEKDPFTFMKSASDIPILSRYFAESGIDGKICVYTDKYKLLEPVCKRYKFRPGIDNNGLFFVDQGGTVLQKIEFLLPSQVKLSIKNAEVEYLTYVQLEKMGYIVRYAN